MRRRGDLPQPFIEDSAGLRVQAGFDGGGRRSKVRNGNSRGGQFYRVTDIPFLKLARISLQVELQGQASLAIRKGLIVIDRVRREPRRVGWQVERIAVPMK